LHNHSSGCHSRSSVCVHPSSFTYLTGIPLDTPEFFTHRIWIAGGWLFLVGTIIAGIYPALFLLRINPIAALKGKFSGTKRGVLTRQSLIIIQFTSSMVLVAFLLVIDSQLDYMRLTNKKIDIENVITVRNPFVYANDDDSVNFAEYKAFKTKLLLNI